jgi:hypothetical protein
VLPRLQILKVGDVVKLNRRKNIMSDSDKKIDANPLKGMGERAKETADEAIEKQKEKLEKEKKEHKTL